MKVDAFDRYTFGLKGESEFAPTGSIMVDGFEVSASTPIATLGRGLHSVVLTATLATTSTATQPGMIELLWETLANQPKRQPIDSAMLFDPRKIEPRGLTGLFRQGQSFDTEPSEGRVDPTISFYFHVTPMVRPYTADWSAGVCPG